MLSEAEKIIIDKQRELSGEVIQRPSPVAQNQPLNIEALLEIINSSFQERGPTVEEVLVSASIALEFPGDSSEDLGRTSLGQGSLEDLIKDTASLMDSKVDGILNKGGLHLERSRRTKYVGGLAIDDFSQEVFVAHNPEILGDELSSVQLLINPNWLDIDYQARLRVIHNDSNKSFVIGMIDGQIFKATESLSTVRHSSGFGFDPLSVSQKLEREPLSTTEKRLISPVLQRINSRLRCL